VTSWKTSEKADRKGGAATDFYVNPNHHTARA